MNITYKIGYKAILKLIIFSLFFLLSFFLIRQAAADTSADIMPTADGTYTSWTPNSGSVHYTRVDETPCNGNTDFNRETTVGQRDSYVVSLSGIPDGATITNIQLTPCASKNSSGGTNSTLNVFYRWNGVDSSDAGNYSLSTTTPANLASTTFPNLALVKGSGSTLEAGAVFTAGNRGVKLSRLATVITYTTLAAPSALSGTPVSETRNDLSWTDNSSNEDGFKIERMVSSGSTTPWGQIDIVGVDQVAYSDTAASGGITYSYRVRSYNSVSDSAYSNTAPVTTILNAPTGLSGVNVTGTRNDLAWTDTSGSESGFKVERKTTSSPTTPWSQIAVTVADQVAYSDTMAVYGRSYDYRVRAYTGSANSDYSNTASVTNVLAAPSNLTGVNISSTQNDLDWDDNSTNETGFKIERKTVTSPSTPFLQIGLTIADTSAFSDTGVSSGITYDYRVRSYYTGGNSTYSNTATVIVP